LTPKIFRNACEEPLSFYVANGADFNMESAAQVLKEKTEYFGGTDLSNIPIRRKASVKDPRSGKMTEGEMIFFVQLIHSVDYSYYLMFSDGISTIGPDVPQSPLEVPVYAFCSDTKANFTNLRIWARNSAGDFFNLSDIKVCLLYTDTKLQRGKKIK
jgi:hypothetical protein